MVLLPVLQLSSCRLDLTAQLFAAGAGPNVTPGLLQKLQLLYRLLLQHAHAAFRQARGSGPVPAGSVARDLGLRLRQQLAVALRAVTQDPSGALAAAAGGNRVFVLGKLDDAIEFLAEGELQTFIGTLRGLGM